jgi:threonyl-tRNA synthetase
MYPFMGEGDQAVCLKPMNCPHHHRIFAARPRSYRDLPLRLAEHGQVYRYEDSGALSGLLRVRGMCMNDAHIYCAPDQVRGELAAVIAMHQRAYEILGLSGFRLRFSTWDPHDPKGREKYVHDPAAWASSQAAVREVLDASGLPYDEGPGEAAFYGPKIDFQLRSVTGREETASTVQLDFAVPARMGLRYVDADGARRTPYVIHRAPLGTHERFVAFLVEHCGGAFPTWLAPVQVRVLCVSDRFRPYAEGVVDALRSEFVRAELDRSGQRVGRMIREAQVRKIPNVLVIGEREQADGSVTLRRRGERRQRAMPAAELQRRVLAAIRARDDAPLGADAV